MGDEQMIVSGIVDMIDCGSGFGCGDSGKRCRNDVYDCERTRQTTNHDNLIFFSFV